MSGMDPSKCVFREEPENELIESSEVCCEAPSVLVCGSKIKTFWSNHRKMIAFERIPLSLNHNLLRCLSQWLKNASQFVFCEMI